MVKMTRKPETRNFNILLIWILCFCYYVALCFRNNVEIRIPIYCEFQYKQTQRAVA